MMFHPCDRTNVAAALSTHTYLVRQEVVRRKNLMNEVIGDVKNALIR